MGIFIHSAGETDVQFIVIVTAGKDKQLGCAFINALPFFVEAPPTFLNTTNSIFINVFPIKFRNIYPFTIRKD